MYRVTRNLLQPLVVSLFFQITLYMMFVAVMAFFVRISDPAVGGTYMTLLNTLANMGTTWPSTLSLYVVDSLTYRSCSVSPLKDNMCSSPSDVKVLVLDHNQFKKSALHRIFCLI